MSYQFRINNTIFTYHNIEINTNMKQEYRNTEASLQCEIKKK